MRMRALIALGVLATATALAGSSFGLQDWRYTVAEIGLLVAMFVISRYVLPLVDRQDRGALAEEQVGGLLDKLPRERWRVIHDATLGRGNVDHIVIGPQGVFTIETKSHPGPVRASRVHGATLAQAQAQGKAIAWVTGVEVQPLVVFSRAWVDRPGARRKGVRVLPARMLLSHLQKGQMRLSASDVDAAHRALADALLEQHGRTRLLGDRWSIRL
jgi:DNA-binding transcriptional LysR family regulator